MAGLVGSVGLVRLVGLVRWWGGGVVGWWDGRVVRNRRVGQWDGEVRGGTHLPPCISTHHPPTLALTSHHT